MRSLSYSLAVILQGESTGEETSGIVQKAAETGKEVTEEADSILQQTLDSFYEGVVGYLTSLQFIVNLILTVLVIVLAVAFYRTAVHLTPRILRWRRPDDEEALDANTLARIKRQDTAITLVRHTLRYVVFAIVALLVLSIFLRNVLPGIAEIGRAHV